jgi:hypothetical protein
MKRTSKFFLTAFALASVLLVSSCKKDEVVVPPEEDTVTPTELSAQPEAGTGIAVYLTWKSSASVFEVKLNAEGALISVPVEDAPDAQNGHGVTVTAALGLKASTDYTWSVRAVTGENSYSEWVSGASFTTPAPAAAAQVRFGEEGSPLRKVWQAEAVFALVDFEDPYIQVQLYSKDPSGWESLEDAEYPFFDFFVVGNTADDYSEENGYTPSYEYDVNYYHQRYLDYFGDGSYIFGDYWMDTDFPSSIEITSVNASTISGTVNLTLMDIFTFMESDYETIINVPLSVTFVNLPVTDYASLAPAAVSKSSVQNSPVLKPGKYPIKSGKSTREKLKQLYQGKNITP